MNPRIIPPTTVFLFSGQGAQYVNMGRQLYETHPSFRRTLEHCDEILNDYLDQSLLKLLYPINNAQGDEEDKQRSISRLSTNEYAQPALFALEYALAELWMSWGIIPNYLMGHSVGEYVAACVAEVFSLEEGLRLMAEIPRLLQALPDDGEMTTVFASQNQVESIIKCYSGQIAIAAVNGPESIVISGESEVVSCVRKSFEFLDITCKKLPISHAFHSPLIKPILPEFRKILKNTTLNKPKIPLISTLTGKEVTTEITDPEYWCRHLSQPVKFTTAINTLQQKQCTFYIEMGPKPALLAMGKECLADGAITWLPSLRQEEDDWQSLLRSLQELSPHNTTIDWSEVNKYHSHKQHNEYDRTVTLENDKSAPFSVQLPIQTAHSPQQETLKRIATFVQQSVRQLMGVAPDQRLDVDESLLNLGLDSLQAVEMRNILEKRFDITLAVSLLFNYPSINRVIEHIEQKILPCESALEEQDSEDFRQLDNLSENDLEELLLQKLDSDIL